MNSHTVMATARGVVISHDANLLLENGGYIKITKSWADCAVTNEFSERKGTTVVKVLLLILKSLRSSFYQMFVQQLSWKKSQKL